MFQKSLDRGKTRLKCSKKKKCKSVRGDAIILGYERGTIKKTLALEVFCYISGPQMQTQVVSTVYWKVEVMPCLTVREAKTVQGWWWQESKNKSEDETELDVAKEWLADFLRHFPRLPDITKQVSKNTLSWAQSCNHEGDWKVQQCLGGWTSFISCAGWLDCRRQVSWWLGR